MHKEIIEELSDKVNEYQYNADLYRHQLRVAMAKIALLIAEEDLRKFTASSRY